MLKLKAMHHKLRPGVLVRLFWPELKLRLVIWTETCYRKSTTYRRTYKRPMSPNPLHLLEFDLDLALIIYHLFQLGFAFLLSLPIALNRESRARGAGLRTFPLVAIAACAFMLVGVNAYSGSDAEARVMYGIITGIGFIGGGAIIKRSEKVDGTATAAGIWNTGAIGVATAYQNYEIAITLCIANYCIFQFSTYFKKNKDIN